MTRSTIVLPCLVAAMALLPVAARAETAAAEPAAATATTPAATSSADEANILSAKYKMGLGFGSSSWASGVTGKIFLGNKLAAQAVLGSAWGWGWQVGADVLMEMPKLWSNDFASLNWHAGVGAEVGFWYGTSLGVAAHAGLGLQLKQWPVEFVTDLRPTLWLGDWAGSGFHFEGGGAARWWF